MYLFYLSTDYVLSFEADASSCLSVEDTTEVILSLWPSRVYIVQDATGWIPDLNGDALKLHVLAA